jgi:hypothetical protein
MAPESSATIGERQAESIPSQLFRDSMARLAAAVSIVTSDGPAGVKFLAIARRVMRRQVFEYYADAIFDAIDAPAIVSDGTVAAAQGRYFLDPRGREWANDLVAQCGASGGYWSRSAPHFHS